MIEKQNVSKKLRRIEVARNLGKDRNPDHLGREH
jgi:hypothetical protein